MWIFQAAGIILSLLFYSFDWFVTASPCGLSSLICCHVDSAPAWLFLHLRWVMTTAIPDDLPLGKLNKGSLSALFPRSFKYTSSNSCSFVWFLTSLFDSWIKVWSVQYYKTSHQTWYSMNLFPWIIVFIFFIIVPGNFLSNTSVSWWKHFDLETWHFI